MTNPHSGGAELRALISATLSDFKTTACVAPSSDALIQAMVSALPLARAECVVEFGAGTGSVTEALLESMPSRATLLSFEINPELAAFTRERLDDPRLHVIPRGAECLGEELRRRGIERVDAIASSLGLTFMPDPLRHRIFDAAARSLKPGGTLTQYVYMHGAVLPFRRFDGEFQRFPAHSFFGSRFSRVERRLIWLNLPPAFLYTCRI